MIFSITWIEWLVIALVTTHITIISVTVYLHRAQAHRALDLHPVLNHFFRLWLWLATGMNTREWVAVHRKHHAHVETKEDPHSPKIYGIWSVVFRGVALYRKATASKDILDRYGAGTPNDWLEHHVYQRKNAGVVTFLLVDMTLFGFGKGSLMWAVQMLWIPVLAAGVINGVGHYIGYRNYQPVDQSRNILPWGILIGGEELHNNHHAYPRSARFSARSFEFDLGYVYIKILSFLRLAKVNYVMPNIANDKLEGVKGVLNARMGIYREFQRRVLTVACREKAKSIALLNGNKLLRLLKRPPQLLKEADKVAIRQALSLDETLNKVYDLQLQLYQIFYHAKGQDMVALIQQWCIDAKASHQATLCEFAEWIEERFLKTVAEGA
ncbi:DesA family fatty acid desaturase [Candidatus Synchoanobacter obligatus]|uniref:Fatty acid desaturase n=1 Tax=Candidatus Synchoanobacter obligatus TaxID=2919597 RepID=A0ABT1L6A9_9GAMM|nr:fatty acid desaturase [Candidatus Synchoanobacter obligatus]MCP8352275.1 fatty acid desaturase [Candidatus Synchoanobacter obligatus]